MTQDTMFDSTGLATKNMTGDNEVESETAVIDTLLTTSQNKYRGLFEATPVSLWEEDFSEVKQFVDQLRGQGVTDFRAYFDDHPKDVSHCIRLVKVTDVNQTTLTLYKASSKSELFNNLDKIFGPEAFRIFKEELILIGNGGTLFENEGINYTIDGQQIDVLVRWSVSPGFEESLSQVIVSIFDITTQKQAAKQLQLQAAALESAANAILISDDNGNILWVNPAFTKLTGYSYNEVLGKNPRILKSGKNSEAFYQDLWQTIKSGQVWHGHELINRRKDGTVYYEQMTVAPVKDDDGQVSRFIAIKEDITERKQMEVQLRRQLQEEELLRRVLSLTTSDDDLKEILAKICEEMAHLYQVPKAAFAMINAEGSQAEVISEYRAAGHPGSMGSIFPVANNASMAFLVTQKKPLAIQDVQHDPMMAPVYPILKQLGIVSLLLFPVLIGDDIVGIMGFEAIQSREFSPEDIALGEKIAIPISHAIQRHQAAQALQKERDFAHQIMGNMGQGLLVLQRDQTIDYCNPAFTGLLGYGEESLLGSSLVDLLSEQTPLEMMEPGGEEGQSRRFVQEVVLKHAKGDLVHVLFTAVPRSTDFDTNGAIVVVTDLSQQKKIEYVLSDARDQAIEASRLKSEFLANMSHEIRTPLNAVIGMTSLMLDTGLTKEQQEYAETIRNSGDVLLSLINHILDFSKIEAGKLELEERPFTVRDCAEEALDVVITKASEKGLELAYIIDDAVPHAIVGDVTRLRQIFVNLLNNAIKFTETGEVVLSVSRLQSKPESKNGKHILLQFSVQDTGIGIPEHRLNRLFKSFSQVDASTTRKYGGTGLGLAISKQLVEMMGGRIWVESEIGKGSTFHFTMATSAAGTRRRVYLQTAQPQLIGKRLLIVDDNETNRLILTKQSRLWGMKPQAAASGPEALMLLREGEQFDLAILDMQMPEMDGVMLASEIRRLQNGKNLPLVLLSSIGDREDIKETSYFSAYLTKPVKQQFLFETLNGLFSDTAVSPTRTPKKLTIDPEMGKRCPLRILLAEDNLVNQKVAARILERMGYRADIAADGLEVLEALQRQPYDVVLMDVQMPYMDGVEATEQIRDIWPPEEQPDVIAMTAHALTGDREKYLEAGMDNYISKPVRIQELLQALTKCKPLAAKQKS